MSVRFHNLHKLGDRIEIPISKDEDGYLGRECPVPACEGYFKIKLGTGLKGADLPCHCPYCGHTDSHNRFWTKEQIEYARSMAIGRITDAIRADLKVLEFEIKPKGPFGMGISMKLKPGLPVPIHYYREKALETHVTCDSCTLEYAVFGVFGYCPDCRLHNSFTILARNLALTRKQITLAQTLTDVDFRRHIVEDALENCVSAFDGFAREACRVRSPKSSDPAKAESLSFQHLPRASKRLQALFGIDFATAAGAADWNLAHIGFMQRHLIAHRSGVIDQQYLDETGDNPALLGRRIVIDLEQVSVFADVVERLGAALVGLLPNA